MEDIESKNWNKVYLAVLLWFGIVLLIFFLITQLYS